jgi:hypothetical protein
VLPSAANVWAAAGVRLIAAVKATVLARIDKLFM